MHDFFFHRKEVSVTVSWRKLRCCYSSNMLQHWVGERGLIYFWQVEHSRISVNISRNLIGLNNLCEILCRAIIWEEWSWSINVILCNSLQYAVVKAESSFFMIFSFFIFFYLKDFFNFKFQGKPNQFGRGQLMFCKLHSLKKLT